MKPHNWAAILHFHSLLTTSAAFKICELLLRLGEEERSPSPSHQSIQATANALNDSVKKFLPWSLANRTTKRCTMCCYGEDQGDTLLAYNSSCQKAGKIGLEKKPDYKRASKPLRLLLSFPKTPSSSSCLSTTTDVTSSPLVTYHSWKRFCPLLPHFLLT